MKDHVQRSKGYPTLPEQKSPQSGTPPHPREEQENLLEDRSTSTSTEVSITSIKKLCFPDLKIGFTIRFIYT